MSLALIALAGKRFADLTGEDVKLLMSTAGVKSTPSPEQLTAIAEMLKSEDIDKLGEILAKPAVMARIKDYLKGVPMREVSDEGAPVQQLQTVHQCGFCKQFSLVTIRLQ